MGLLVSHRFFVQLPLLSSLPWVATPVTEYRRKLAEMPVLPTENTRKRDKNSTFSSVFRHRVATPYKPCSRLVFCAKSKTQFRFFGNSVPKNGQKTQFLAENSVQNGQKTQFSPPKLSFFAKNSVQNRKNSVFQKFQKRG